MNKATLSLILVNVLMTATAQLTLKAGMSAPRVVMGLEGGFRLSSVATIFTNPFVIAGLAIYFLSAVLWLVVLSRTDVSLAYPFVSLGFVITMVLGALLYGEVLTVGRVVGTLLIVTGVIVLARN
jgi:multidrug transporter EmrE-like cation transporter